MTQMKGIGEGKLLYVHNLHVNFIEPFIYEEYMSKWLHFYIFFQISVLASASSAH